MTLRVLVTNDDGIAAPGIQALARAAAERGLDVVVAAPLEEASGTSAAMTAVERDGHVVVHEHPLPELHQAIEEEARKKVVVLRG